MKRILTLTCMFLVFVFGVLTISVAAVVIPMNTVSAAKIEISKKKAKMYVDDEMGLKIKGTNEAVEWSSSNKKVVSVNKKGRVFANKAGKAKIIGKVGNKKYICYITVLVEDWQKNLIQVKKLKLNKNDLSLDVGKCEKLTAHIDAKENSYKIITWKSADSKIATVSNSGEVTAVSAGTTKITAFLGVKKATCVVTVTEQFGSVSGNVTYLYNNYKGNVADTNATVILISTTGTAQNMPSLPSYVNWGLSTTINKYNDYGVYMTKVDGTGKYSFNHIPVGEYKVVVVSKNTTSGLAFSDLDSYKHSIANMTSTYINDENAKYLGEYVGYNKFVVDTIMVYTDKDSYFGYDFDITYN